MRTNDIWVWPFDYGNSAALYDKIMSRYEAIKDTDHIRDFIERLAQWILSKKYPLDFHNNHIVLLKCVIKASRSTS